MGRGRAFASACKAAPPEVEPVKAPAAMAGWRMSVTPTSRPPPCTMPIKAEGKPWSFNTFCANACTRLDNIKWPVWALTTTGQPAAKAEAVSPPNTENANGKLLAENMATGPKGTRCSTMLGWPTGGAPATAGSSKYSNAAPPSAMSANLRS